MNEHRRSKVVANRSYPYCTYRPVLYCTVPTGTRTVFNKFLYSIVRYACSHALTAARDSLHYCTCSNKAKILQTLRQTAINCHLFQTIVLFYFIISIHSQCSTMMMRRPPKQTKNRNLCTLCRVTSNSILNKKGYK